MRDSLAVPNLGPKVKISNSRHSIEIDRIDIQGMKAFTAPMIEDALEISPGDLLERTKVIQTEENLQSLYRSRGYEEMSVRSKLVRKKNENKAFETVLEFDIHEGKVSRISSIKILFDPASDEAVKKFWIGRERKLVTSFGLKVGDAFDQEKVSEGKRAIQELLASEDYVGAKVEQIRVASSHASGSHVQNEDTSKWIALEVEISLGDRVSFGFRGNTFFTRGYLNSLVDEQRLLGLGKDYIGIIRNRLEEEYRAAGFARVEISSYTIESPRQAERKVVYVVVEGPRVKIESVDFDGNVVFDVQKLREKFFSKASGLVQRGVFVDKDVQKAAELLVEWMKESGYLSAKLITVNLFYPPKPRTQQANSSVRLLIYVYEGAQTKVQNFQLEGLTVFSRAEVEKLLNTQEGNPLNLFALSEGIELLKKNYREKGFLGFRILNEGSDSLIKYSQENQAADISLQLDEGPQFQVSHIEIEGLVKTQDFIVRRDLEFAEGEVLTESKIIQSERNLRRLGIFSAVNIRYIDDPTSPGSKIVRIGLQEADRGILTWGPGFRNDLGVRAFGQLAYTNLWGLNHTASVTANVNRRYYLYNFIEGQAQFAYTWPWFKIADLTFRPVVSLGQTQYLNFAAQTITVATTWDKQLMSQPNVNASFTYTFERIRQFNAKAEVDDQQLRIGSVTPKMSLDLRDNPLAPTSGLFTTAWLDLAHPALGSQMEIYPIGYYRLQFRSDYHIPLWRDIVWYFSFRTGYEKSFDFVNNSPYFQEFTNADTIPLIRQFALGGIGSVRGYQELEINKHDAVIHGSLAYTNYRTQVDLPFSGALRFGLFLDAANLLVDDYSLGKLRYGVGFGLHYLTPVGAVNFDWGFKLDPPPKSDPYVIHFSVGVI
jgi:outer membrane protein insertion porin family